MALTNQEAAAVLAMIARGDKHHDIAAWFGVNQGRIAEVEKGPPLPPPGGDLPPKGPPGLKGRRVRHSAERALAALGAGDVDAAKKLLQDGIAAFDKHEG